MSSTLIGIISDTHRTIPDKALRIFEGVYDPSRIIESYGSPDIPLRPVDYIIHAGDIGDDDASVRKVLSALEAIAPVHAVLGNCDIEEVDYNGERVTSDLRTLNLDGLDIMLAHDPKDLTRNIRGKGMEPTLAVHGHTHRYGIQETASGIRMNPGAIHDPRNDSGHRSVALVYAEDGGLKGIAIVRL